MGSKMNRSTYEQMIAENLAWLARMPQCPERVHIEQIVKDSVFRLYDQADRIAALEAEKAEYEREKLKRESQEPVAFRWLGPGKGWRAVYAEPPVSRELEARIRELEAEKAEREQNGINSQWLTGVIRRADPKMSLTSDELAEKILDAINGRLTLREPTDEECSRIYAIADRNPITRGSEIGEMPVRAGRAMWQAVREVMTK